MPDLSVVIVSFNTRDLLRRCLSTLYAEAAALDLEVIVADNGSRDGSAELVRSKFPRALLLLNDTNTGFAAANNQGLARAQAPYVLLLNSDAFVNSRVLERALATLRAHPCVGLVGVRIDNIDGTLQAEHGRFPTLLDDILVSAGLDRAWRRRPRPVAPGGGAADWVHGACMFVRRDALDQVGPLDTRYFMYSEEVEWCRRFWMCGWQVWYLPDAGITHVGGGSSSGNDLGRRVALYRARLGFRRVCGGPLASAILWFGMLAGLTLRATGRTAIERAGRRLGRQSAANDWALLGALSRTDPFARWVVSRST